MIPVTSAYVPWVKTGLALYLDADGLGDVDLVWEVTPSDNYILCREEYELKSTPATLSQSKTQVRNTEGYDYGIEGR